LISESANLSAHRLSSRHPEDNKNAFTSEFVQRALHDGFAMSMTPAGIDRTAAINEFGRSCSKRFI
jgi:hypothetical protein